MIDLSWLDSRASGAWFGAETFHEPVPLRHLPDARLLWLNQQAVEADPQFGGDLAAYERHLLDSCAYVVAQAEDIISNAVTVTGYADRYGGGGIGSNGGSGRAAVVNGYLVKGIGRTRLVSSLTEPSHASGGAYLEESVRETIFSEIVRAEFPHSAVPVLAIIDTGLIQVWPHDFGPAVERRTLVVRPCFVRPAHFLRATGFVSGAPKEGQRDALRVQAMFARAQSTLGVAGLAEAFETLWLNWARQLAYSFVHRLSHGSNTMSNICFDGKLLDFGAMSALPSWADCATQMTRQPFASQTSLLVGLISSSAYYFGRHLDPRIGSPAEQQRLAAVTREQYRHVVMVEGLRLCGLSRGVAEKAAQGPARERIWRCLRDVIGHFQRERIDMVERVPAPLLDWDLAQVWTPNAPPHLHALQSLLRSLVGEGGRSLAARRCTFLTATRENLFREESKPFIYHAVDPSRDQRVPERGRIGQFICEQIAQGRRDHRLSIDDAVPLGFAVSSAVTYVLFQEAGSVRRFAVPERMQAVSADEAEERYLIETCSSGELVFADPAVASFSGHVQLH